MTLVAPSGSRVPPIDGGVMYHTAILAKTADAVLFLLPIIAPNNRLPASTVMHIVYEVVTSALPPSFQMLLKKVHDLLGMQRTLTKEMYSHLSQSVRDAFIRLDVVTLLETTKPWILFVERLRCNGALIDYRRVADIRDMMREIFTRYASALYYVTYGQ